MSFHILYPELHAALPSDFIHLLGSRPLWYPTTSSVFYLCSSATVLLYRLICTAVVADPFWRHVQSVVISLLPLVVQHIWLCADCPFGIWCEHIRCDPLIRLRQSNMQSSFKAYCKCSCCKCSTYILAWFKSYWTSLRAYLMCKHVCHVIFFTFVLIIFLVFVPLWSRTSSLSSIMLRAVWATDHLRLPVTK